MKENLHQVFRANQNYVTWGGFGLFGTEIYKTKMFTHVQDSKAEKLCFCYPDLTPKGIRLHRIKVQDCLYFKVVSLNTMCESE